MATIVTRSGKGSPLTNNEVDANFTNLNTDKLESGDTAASLTITSADINGGNIDGTIIGAATPAAGSFTTFTSNGIDDNASATAVTLDASGNVGIGTTSPEDPLHVAGDIRTDNAAYIVQETSTGGAVRMLGINAGNSAYIGPIDSGPTDAIFNASSTSNTSAFYTAGSERMRIDSSGNLLVGTTTSIVTSTERVSFVGSVGLSVQSNGGASSHAGAFWNAAASGDNMLVRFYTDTGASMRGSIDYNRLGGLVRYNTTSDYRAKDILGPVENAGATIDALNVYEGVMKGATQSRPMLIAHEAQEQAPYAVSGTKDAVNEDGTPDYQQIDHSSLVPLLIAEIQSLRARVAQLEGA